MTISLASKFRMIFAAFILILVGFGWFAIDRLGAVNDQAVVLSSVWLPRIETIKNAQIEVKQYRIYEARHILSLDSASIAESDDNLTKQQAKIGAALLAYNNLARTEEDHAKLNHLSSTWKTYVASNAEMLSFSRLNKNDEATDAFRGGKPRFDNISAEMNQIADSDREQAGIARDSVISTYASVRAVTIGLTILVVLLSVCGAIYFEKSVSQIIVQITEQMNQLAGGRLDVKIEGAERHDEIGEMSRAVQIFKDNAVRLKESEALAEQAQIAAEGERSRNEAIQAEATRHQQQVVQAIARGLDQLSGGGLTYRIMDRFAADYEKLRVDFNDAMEKLQQTMLVVSTNTSAIRSGTDEISSAADDLSKRTEQQAASLEETAAALDEITATVRKTAEGANHARQVVGTAKTAAEHSGQVVRQAVEAMSGIERSSGQIGNIIGVIDEIAFQTNLLALNAGVEAARAGDAGRGFAVVASEVRALAQRSADAAKEIKALISTSSDQVAKGVDLVAETGKALERIVAQVTEINGIVGEIAASAHEQATALDQVNTAINQMDQVTQQNAAMVEESTAASHALTQETEQLAQLIGRFEIGQSSATPVRSARKTAPSKPATTKSAITLKTVGHGGAVRKPHAVTDDQSWQEF